MHAVLGESFVASRAPREWRDVWLGVDHRDGHTVRVGAEVSTVDECLEAVLTGRGIAFTQASCWSASGYPVKRRDRPPAGIGQERQNR